MSLKGKLKWTTILFIFVVVTVIALVFLAVQASAAEQGHELKNLINEAICFWC